MESGGFINTTQLMAFQKDQNHAGNTMTISVPRRKSHKLFYEYMHIEPILIDVKKEPEKIKIRNQTYC